MKTGKEFVEHYPAMFTEDKEWWAENYKDIGKKEGYTEAEIAEYGHYIELFQKIGK